MFRRDSLKQICFHIQYTCIEFQNRTSDSQAYKTL